MATKAKYSGKGKFARAKKTRQADMLRRASRHTEERQAREARKAKAPAVTYHQPSPFNARRLGLRLALVALVAAAILLGVSVFFRVERVMVYGSSTYDPWTIREASGITDGENLMTIGAPRAGDRILDRLPYVQDVRIGVTLPDTVNIYITEYPVVYSVEDTSGTWWLMGSDGKIVEKTDVGAATAHTRILGLQVKDPVAGQTAVPAESAPETATNAAGEQIVIPVITSAADRLKAALTVMTSLEKYDVLGQMATVDVTYPGDIRAWYGERFEVMLGDSKQMDKKIAWMKDAVGQMADYQTGTLDLTFTIYRDQAGYTPFS